MTRCKSNLELHEAMVLLLLEKKHASGAGVLDTSTIAKAIKSRDLYRQDLGGYADASQIGARARQYPALFKRQLVEGNSHVRLLRLPRRSQLVAKVVASKS